MSYDPPSGENQPPPPGGQPTQPTGGYNPPPPPSPSPQPPPSGGGYSAPPPPSSGSGYTPPGGGYTPPPNSGYTPPPSGGGYTPPPPSGGGYGAPPPPPRPSGPGNMGGMGNMNISQASIQGYFQKCIKAITKPSAATYEGEIPHANWNSVIVGLVAATAVGFLIGLIKAFLPVSLYTYNFGTSSSAFNSGFGSYLTSVGIGGAFLSLILIPLSFFIGAALLFGMARLFGGTGSNFLTHSYLLSLSWTPLKIIAAVVGIIPIVGSLIGLLIYLYQIYSAGLAMQASQRMQPGRAQLAAFLPTIVGLVFACLCAILIVMTGAAFLNGLGNR